MSEVVTLLLHDLLRLLLCVGLVGHLVGSEAVTDDQGLETVLRRRKKKAIAI
jgi:hypothetical protein